MKTTAELISFIGCDSCSDYVSCDIKDHCRWKACAERLESQENEIADLKKQIADYDLNGQIRARDESLKRRKERNVLLEEEIEKLKWDNAALEATVENQRKQIAETYTEKQYRKDSMRFCKVYAGDFCSKCPIKSHCAEGDEKQIEYIQEWAKSHPEPPKISNGDKFKEVFGRNPKNDFCLRPEPKCIHAEDATTCNHCDYGCNGEYKVPSDK